MERAPVTPPTHDQPSLGDDESALSTDGPSLVKSERTIRWRPILLVALVTSAACVPARLSSNGQSSLDSETAFIISPLNASSARSSARHLGRADLLSVDGESVADAVRQLRPDWLRPNRAPGRATELVRPSVYINGAYAGSPDELRLVPLGTALDLRFLPPSAAWDQFGAACRCDGGVILVVTRADR